jgi:hypothetical protein
VVRTGEDVCICPRSSRILYANGRCFFLAPRTFHRFVILLANSVFTLSILGIFTCHEHGFCIRQQYLRVALPNCGMWDRKKRTAFFSPKRG